MNNIVQFHIQHGYYVQIKEIGDTPGCIANFPQNLLLDRDKITRTYMLYDDPYTIDIFTIQPKYPVITQTIKATSSNIRLLVLEDVFLQTYKLGMSKDLIVVENNSKTLFDMLQLKQTKKELQEETQLCVQFRELLEGNVVSSDIEGYEQVLSCFENGGL